MAPTQNEEEIETVLHDAQNWAARSHQDLYTAVHNNNDPGQAGEIGSEWGQFGSEMTEAAQLIADRVTATESGWTGEAADSARAAIKLLSDWVTETAETAVEVGNRVADQGRVMATARANMPEPVLFQWDAATQMLSAPGLGAFVASAADVQAANEQARGAHEQAVAVMNAMEQESRNVDRTTPVFKPPFNPVTGETEEPVVAMARTSGVSLAGASAGPAPAARPDGFTASGADGGTGGAGTGPAAGSGPGAVAANPGTGTGTAWQASNAPAAAGYPSGSGAPSQWQSGSTDHTTAAAATYQPAAPPMPTSHGYPSGTMPTSTGGMTWDPTTGQPTGFGTGKNTPAPGAPGAVPPGKMPGNFGPGGPGGPGLTGGAGGSGGGAGGAGAKGAFGGAGAFGSGALGGAGGPGGAVTQPGGSTGTLQPGQQQAMARGGAAPVGPGAAGAAGAAGAPMGGAPGAGRGEEDKEHRSASYIMSGDLFEVPGENLPPAVIGGAKKKKEQDQ
ncbi:PPE domain-containing protein [Lentzea tibetensis]|uniref:PPE domain-containing protein n=1 Tax=Lentzea tibetensis TaxID=2591470 RepID=A0A563EY98_9PSEU|nr:PPE domain-containing protein [Lentzea tibetensis]TWP52522.1 PPE domain-containing protein [Lentzea tibetensis]